MSNGDSIRLQAYEVTLKGSIQKRAIVEAHDPFHAAQLFYEHLDEGEKESAYYRDSLTVCRISTDAVVRP